MAAKKKKPRKVDYSDPRVRKLIALSKKWVEPFLELLADGAWPGEAAEAVHVNKRTVYSLRDRDPDFRKRWEDARAQFALFHLEPKVMDLCMHGVRKKKFTKDGDPVIDPETGKQYEEVEYFPGLMQFALRGGMPEKYGDKSQVDVTSGGKPLTVKVLRGVSMDDL